MAVEENNVVDFNEEVEGFTEEAEKQEVKSNKAIYTHVVAGLGTGTVVGLGWFVEHQQNKEIGKAIKRTLHVAKTITKGEETTKFDKEEIKLAGKALEHPIELIGMIENEINNTKFVTKRKKKQWNEMLKLAIELATFLTQEQFERNTIVAEGVTDKE